MRRWLLILAPVALIGGAVYGLGLILGCFPHHIDDVTFVSLTTDARPDHVTNMLLRIRSHENLRRLAGDSSGATAVVSVCPFQENPTISVGRIAHNDVEISARPSKICITYEQASTTSCHMADDTAAVREEVAHENEDEVRIYEIALVYSGKQIEAYQPDGEGGWSFRDVALPPDRDYCMRFRSDGPPGYVSNIVRIPKDAVARALRDVAKLKKRPPGAVF